MFIQVLLLQFLLLLLKTNKSMNIEELVTKNESTYWYLNQTSKFLHNKPYCEICCMDLTAKSVGKRCGSHTMCIYDEDDLGPSCKSFIMIDFNEQERFILLDAHNTIRNTIASGRELRGSPGPQPSASNMRIIEWSDELESIAKRWIRQCVFRHDVCRDTELYPVGQNIARGNFATTNDLFYIKQWYDLVKFFNKENIDMYLHFPTDKEFLKQYTQLVWADTYQIGCARAVFQEGMGNNVRFREHLFCNYGPTGNIPGLPVYNTGKPCSHCPEGTGCTVEYPALCGNELIYEINYEKITPINDTMTNGIYIKPSSPFRIIIIFSLFLQVR